MAFQTAQGYGNLPNGVFSPQIFSKKAQIAFRKTSVVSEITNSDYFGEIEAYGDTVHVIQEPDIAVAPYARGQQLTSQNLVDNEITLTVDHANQFQFQIDDLEMKQSHLNWESLASNRAAYKMKDAYDTEVLSYMASQIPTAGSLGAVGAPQKLGFNGTTQLTPLNTLARLNRYLDINLVPSDERWCVVDPVFYEMLLDENSKLLNALYTAGTNGLTNNKVSDETIRGFMVYKSNNLPSGNLGPTGTDTASYGTVLAGHMSSTATAEQLNKVEQFRSPNTFADVVRGLHMYGRKVLRPTAIVQTLWNQSA